MNLNSKSTTEDTRERKYEEELLKSLHLACERILTSENNIEGLSLCIQSIFLHGLDAKHNQEYYSILAENFHGLNFLLLDIAEKSEDQRRRKNEQLNEWIFSKISQRELGNAFSQLFSNNNNIDRFYTQSAFLCRAENRIILLKCISTIESHYSRRKTDSSDSSYMSQSSTSNISAEQVEKSSGDKFHATMSMPNIRDRVTHILISSPSSNEGNSFESENKLINKRESSSTIDAFEAEEAHSFDYNRPSMRRQFEYKVPIQLINVDDIEIHTDCHSPNSLHEKSKPLNISKSIGANTSLHHIASKNILPSMSTSPTEIFFNVGAVDGGKLKNHYSSPVIKTFSDEKSKKSKSSRHNLAIFLQSLNISSRTKVDLDREARHFHLSEAIIATSQHMKMNRLLSQKYNMPESRRGRDINPKKKQHSASPNYDKKKTKFTIGSTEDEHSDSSEETNNRNPSPIDNVPDTSPHLEWNGDPHAAESIALMLMSKFKSQPLPNPSELYWLVNETQAPQQILPFGDLSLPINPDDDLPYHSIRGNDTWAPPRNMLIFHVQPAPERRRLLMQQNHRCAGCGMKVAPGLMHTFRYCHYLGKYFCSACHKNQIAIIPARVISTWDFTLYHVSNFSLKWLDEIWNLPLFHIGDLKPQLYEKVKQLRKAKSVKVKFQAIAEFITKCRFAEREKNMLKQLPEHWLDDVDVWSMNDFVDVKNGTFTKKIFENIRELEMHILLENCELCRARGWLCEGCSSNKNDVIFPWQDKISRCPRCGTCYHEKCFKDCNKCERLKKRSFILVKKSQT